MMEGIEMTTKRTQLHGRIAPLLFTALAAVPVGGALTSTSASAAAAAKSSAKTHTYKGSTINTSWGPIQVVIAVKNKRITNVKVTDPTHTARSAILDSQAISVLKAETLSAQSARINTVSGATSFSQAYIQSLQSAITSARL
jgi:uncharacterized protein with FMN-binding domain